MLSKSNGRFFECLFGVNKLGAIFVPINWRLAAAEVAFIIRNAGQRAFIESEFQDLVADARALGLSKLIAIDGSSAGSITYEDWLAPLGSSYRMDRSTVDTAMLMYTSGSTGRPKGVMLSNRNWAKCCDIDRDPWPTWWQCTPQDVVLMPLPTFHVGAMEVALRSILSGGLLILLRDFDPRRIIESIW